MRPRYHTKIQPSVPAAVDGQDDESKLLRSTKESPAMKRLGRVLEEKKRLNSSINSSSKRLHNMSKSFRRQTLQDNNRNLARALQKFKERQRSTEDQIVDLKREKQELVDELGKLRQMVGKKDIELNSIVEERVEKRLSEIRQTASQLMELSSSVVSLCLGERMSLTGRPSSVTGPCVEDGESGRPDTEDGPPLGPSRYVTGAHVLTRGGTCQSADLSLITESSFLDQSGFAPIQFSEEARYLHTVTESDEERRSRSRSSTRSRRSVLLGRSTDSLTEPSSRLRSHSGPAQITETTEHQKTEHTDKLDNQKTENTEPEQENSDIPDGQDNVNDKSTDNVGSPESTEKTAVVKVPRIVVEDPDDSRFDISAAEFLRQRFPGGDKIARTPPRTSGSLSNSSSKTNTPRSGTNTPKFDAFNVQVGDAGANFVNSFTPTRASKSPKVVKKSTNQTCSFIPMENDKKTTNQTSSDKAKSGTSSRVVKAKRQKEKQQNAPEEKQLEVQSESESKPEATTNKRRRTYSLEAGQKLNAKVDTEKTKLNGTFDKDTPDILSESGLHLETETVSTETVAMDNVSMETVAMEAATVVAAIAVPEVESDNLDDSLGVLDATVLDTLDMELTAVITTGIRLDRSTEDPHNTKPGVDAPDQIDVPEKGVKRPRLCSPRETKTKEVPEKLRRKSPSGRKKKDRTDVAETPEPSTSGTSGRNRNKQPADGGDVSDGECSGKPVRKSRTKPKPKEEDSANESTSSADESAATFHFYRSKPGKFKFIAGRKDENSGDRPSDPVALMKKSRSKSKKKIEEKVNKLTDSEDSPYAWNGQETAPSVESLRRQKAGEEVCSEEVTDKAVFKIPVATARTKSKKGTSKVDPAEESVKPRSRRTTVVRTYRENSSDDDEAPRLVPDPDSAKRRQTKLIRRVSAVPKTLPEPVDDVIDDDVSINVIDDTVHDVTADGNDGSDSLRTKTYSQSWRRETHVIKPNNIRTLDARRTTQVLSKAEIRQSDALPAAEVTLPEPEVMPFDAAEAEVEPEEPEVADIDEEMTLDLTKLIKSIKRDKALAPPEVDEDMTLDLTKLLKGIDREKMARDARHVTPTVAPQSEKRTVTPAVVPQSEKRTVTPAVVPQSEKHTVTPAVVPQSSKPAVTSKLPSVLTKQKKIKPKPVFSTDSEAEEPEADVAVKKYSKRLSSEFTKRPSTDSNERPSTESNQEVPKSRSKLARKKEPRSKTIDHCKTGRAEDKENENQEIELRKDVGKRRPSVELNDIASVLTNERGEVRTSVSVSDLRRRSIRGPVNHVTDNVTPHVADNVTQHHVLQSRNSTVKKSGRKTKKGSESEVLFEDEDEMDAAKRLSYNTSPKRPRRGQTKSYKEPSLNGKMRREVTADDAVKKGKKKSTKLGSKRSSGDGED